MNMANIMDFIGGLSSTDKKVKIGKQTVLVKTALTVDEYASCIYMVANACYDDSGEYRPEFKEIAKRYAYIKYFTDIELGDIGAEELFKASQESWYDSIISAIEGTPIYCEIERGIDAVLDNKNANRPTKFDQLCADVSAIITKDNTQNLADIKEVLDKLEKVDKKAFVDKAVDRAVAKNKVGEKGGKKS